MKNSKSAVFFLLLASYAIGIFIGALRQAGSASAEMYEYLSGALSQYAPTVTESIKGVFADNAKLLVLILSGGLFKAGIILSFAALIMKGYAVGFSITAALRLYGIKGFLLCGANILSMMVLIPSIALFSASAFSNLTKNSQSRGEILKKFFFTAIFLTAIFCVDSLFRGFLSATFMKLSAFFTKSA